MNQRRIINFFLESLGCLEEYPTRIGIQKKRKLKKTLPLLSSITSNRFTQNLYFGSGVLIISFVLKEHQGVNFLLQIIDINPLQNVIFSISIQEESSCNPQAREY